MPADAASERGLSSATAAKRLRELGPPPEVSSRSVSSIVAGNVFTLFNAIIGAFFVLDLGLGLYADSIFGLIAVINSYIGIRQELKAKRTLDELAVLVAPHAKVIRDGAVTSLLAEEIVPGDVIRVEPGDQLVADGEMLSTRGMTLDESMLTGEADGVRKDVGDRVLSGSFCISGSGYYEADAVREQSYAGKLAGEARAFRHPPSPLQGEVNRVIIACVYVMAPLAVLLILTLKLRNTGIEEAAQTATAGLVTLVPEGLVLLMSVTFAVAAVRLARKDTLVQQMSATESLASVDTICVDKTGTLTDGELRLVGVEVAEGVDVKAAHAALGRFSASAGDRNRTLEGIAERFPGEAGRVSSEVPFSSEWKWSGLRIGSTTYVLGAPDVLSAAGALALPPGLARVLERETAAGRRVVAFGETSELLPAHPSAETAPRLAPIALVVLEETLRPDAAETIALMREEDVDLKLISGDARATVTAVAAAVGVPQDAGVIEGHELPEDAEGLAAAAQRNTVFCRIKPEQKRDLVGALAASGRYAAMIGDGVNDVPALKRARMAVAMGSGAQVTKGVADVVLLKDEFARLPQAVGEGRRIARNIHRLGRLYLTKTVYAAALILLVAIPGFAFPFLPRHLTLAAFLTIGIPSFVLALAPSDGPLYRGRLLRALAAFAVPAGLATALGSILSFFFVDTVFGGSLEAGRTAATTTLIVLGLSFVLLLERGPGREHIAIQSYMLALVAGLGALFALILAAAPVRDFFEMALLNASQWFLALLSAAIGLTIASILWRLPQVEELETPVDLEGAAGPSTAVHAETS
ncbi:MAG: cation-transporting P-type ATPase [Solirubrobacterales bacterium]|jgi:magnesium-transporting ATPase (P-type)|nr:cation-transporting P-type ATPase [Solirubrobacterales bacterium]